MYVYVCVCACVCIHAGLRMGLGISKQGNFQGADSILSLVVSKYACDGKRCQLAAVTPSCTSLLVLKECDCRHSPPSCSDLRAGEDRLVTSARGKAEAVSLCLLSALQRWDEAVEVLLKSYSMRSCNWPVFCRVRWG